MTTKNPPSTIQRLIADLNSPDGLVRQLARQALVQKGDSALPSLTQAFREQQEPAHYEAAKALSQTGRPGAIPALLSGLEDEKFTIRWIAAEGLIAMGPAAVPPLLKTLTLCPDSVYLREGAHHVFFDLVHRNLVDARIGTVLTRVLKAYHPWNFRETISLAAEDARTALKGGQSHE